MLALSSRLARTVALGSLVLLVCVACGGGFGSVSPAPSGYSGAMATSQPSFVPPTQPDKDSTAAAPTSTKTDPSGAPPTLPDGYILEPVGMQAGGQSSSGEMLVQFTVTAIDVDPTCTKPDLDPPERGHLIVLHFEVQTFPALAPTSFSLTDADFSVLGAGGTSTNYNKTSGDCLLDEKPLVGVSAGKTESGVVEVGSEVSTGLVTLSQTGTDGGWAWEF